MSEITARQMQIIHNSWNHVVTGNSNFGMMFYERLFQACPHFKKLFSEDVLVQSFRLTSIVSSLIYHIDKSKKVNIYLRRLGEKHTSQYGVKKTYYPVLGDVFVATLRESCISWNTEMEEAWKCLYNLTAKKMIE